MILEYTVKYADKPKSTAALAMIFLTQFNRNHSCWLFMQALHTSRLEDIAKHFWVSEKVQAACG